MQNAMILLLICRESNKTRQSFVNLLNHLSMKRFFIFATALTMILAFQETNAQSLRQMVKRKIINDNLEAQAKRDSVKAVEEGREPDKSPNTTMNHVYLDALGLSGNVDYKSTYQFDAFIQMEVSEYKKNGNLDEQVIYDTHISKDKIDYAMVFSDKDNKSTIIFDQENSAMLILSDNDGEKTGFAMGIDSAAIYDQVEAYEEESDWDPYAAKKTGKKKDILGYSCEEYFIEDTATEVRMWISEELGKKVRKNMLSNQQTFGMAFYYAAHANGMVLEYDVLDKDDGERTLMKVIDLDMNRSHSIPTRGYAIMSMKNQSPEEEEE